MFAFYPAYNVRVIVMGKIFILSDKNSLFHKFRYIFVFSLCVLIAAALTAYPDIASKSISSALEMCAETVIPSLFPFLFLSSFITCGGFFESGGKVLSFIAKKLFSLPECSASVFIMSALGGFPVGAKMTDSLLGSEKIGKESAKRLLCASVNPSPAFALGAIGLSLFSDTKPGIIIYSSVVISNLFILFISRFVFGDDDFVSVKKSRNDVRISAAFVSAGSAASQAMISICCYVLLFSCLCDLMRIFITNETVLGVLCGICEVTAGTRRLAPHCSIPLIAGVVGWGGLSVHAQIMDCVEKSGLGIKLFFASRAVCASLCVIISNFLLYLFPSAVEAVKISGGITVTPDEKSFPVSVLMLITCFLFLIGDCRIKRNVENKRKI